MNDSDYPKNIDATPLAVRHSELTRWSERSQYKSHCPHDGCDGLLLVARDQDANELLERDYCLLCGQTVIYLDIDEIRQQLG